MHMVRWIVDVAMDRQLCFYIAAQGGTIGLVDIATASGASVSHHIILWDSVLHKVLIFVGQSM